jgi:hypothetical protein
MPDSALRIILFSATFEIWKPLVLSLYSRKDWSSETGPQVSALCVAPGTACGSLQGLAYILLFQKHEFSVEMTCEGCAEAVSRVLNKLGGECGPQLGVGWRGRYTDVMSKCLQQSRGSFSLT